MSCGSHLLEFGDFAQECMGFILRLASVIEDHETELTVLTRNICQTLIEQGARLTDQINTLKAQVAAMSTAADLPRRVQCMPGVRPITALVVETFALPKTNSGAGAKSPRGSPRFPASAPSAANSGLENS